MKTDLENWIKALPDERKQQLDVIANSLFQFVTKVHQTLEVVSHAIISAVKKAEISHERAALLDLYRSRHKWKKSDLKRIQTYRVNKFAKNRLARLMLTKSLGRGTTVPFMPWPNQILEVGTYFRKLYDPTTTSHERLRLLKFHKTLCPQFIEMTYRGEYRKLKQSRIRGAHEKAEQAVADAFIISRSAVRKAYVSVRKDPNFDFNSEVLTVFEFNHWKLTGSFPANK